MKILHTADWHLGKKLDHFSRIEEQRIVLNEICEIADQQKLPFQDGSDQVTSQFVPFFVEILEVAP